MKILDADATILTDPEGNEAVRDIVQFVQYEDFEQVGIRQLAQAVLGEVPDQFVDYMVMKDSINTVGKNLYKGKRTLNEIIAGAQKAEKLEVDETPSFLKRSKTIMPGSRLASNAGSKEPTPSRQQRVQIINAELDAEITSGLKKMEHTKTLKQEKGASTKIPKLDISPNKADNRLNQVTDESEPFAL